MNFMELPSEAELRNRWKWFVGFGVVLVILGAIALWNVVDATLVTTIFIGWLLVLGGIVQIIGAFATSGSMGARVLMGVVGILYAIVGFNIVADPLQGAVALTIVIAIVLIVEGIIRLFAAFNEATPQRGLVAVLAVINILLGLWLWSGIPTTGVAIGFFVGLQLLFAGILMIVGGFAARSAIQSAVQRPAG
jgi:uncharacterized membrane protein HdeD (DUF308 family)